MKTLKNKKLLIVSFAVLSGLILIVLAISYLFTNRSVTLEEYVTDYRNVELSTASDLEKVSNRDFRSQLRNTPLSPMIDGDWTITKVVKATRPSDEFKTVELEVQSNRSAAELANNITERFDSYNPTQTASGDNSISLTLQSETNFVTVSILTQNENLVSANLITSYE